MAVVFLNYRREETAGEARALFSDLRTALGPQAVFMDVDNIALGRDFRQVLHERLQSVDIMLTLIGRDWLNLRNAAGKRRLDDPNDFVRREISAALERDIAVIPVLLQGAEMPVEGDLPEDIRALAFRNAFEISHSRWNSDVHELLERVGLTGPTVPSAQAPASKTAAELPAASAVRTSVPAASASEPNPAKRPSRWRWPVVLLCTVVVAGGAAVWYRQAEVERSRQAQARAETERLRLQQQAEQARAAAEAASAAAQQAQAQREREREEAAKELAEAQARQRAAEKAAQEREAAARQQAARAAAAEKAALEQAARDRAARDQAARDQAARDQAVRDQAAKDQAAREQAARDQAAREQADRSAAAQAAKDRRMAAIARGQYTGSLAGALGDYAEWRGIPLASFSDRDATVPCGKWSEQMPADDARNFRLACLRVARDHQRLGMKLGARPPTATWQAFCEQVTGGWSSITQRNDFVTDCVRFR